MSAGRVQVRPSEARPAVRWDHAQLDMMDGLRRIGLHIWADRYSSGLNMEDLDLN